MLLREMSATMLEPDSISYNAGIGACEKGSQCPRALMLSREMSATMLKRDSISYNASITVCDYVRQ